MTAAPHGGLRVATAREVCDLPEPSRSRQVVGPLLVRGERTVLGGHTGEGKTTFGLQMIRAAVSGDDFLGYEGSCGRALVIDAEQGLRVVKRRLSEARLDACNDVDYLRVPDGLRLDQDGSEAGELEAIIAGGEYAAVLFDPLYKLHGGDSNEERDAVALMRRLDRWREQHDFALLLATHCRKPYQRSSLTLHDLFGSSAYTRGAEVVLGVQKVGPGRSRLHIFKDRPGDLPQGEVWKLSFDREQGFQRDPDDSPRGARAIDLVRALLCERPGLSKREIQEATGKKERTVSKALNDLAAVSDDSHPKGWRLSEKRE
jgi:hypothetical protein